MIEAIKQKLSESADLVVTWLTNNGMNLAGRILAALVILLVGALVIKLFERRKVKTPHLQRRFLELHQRMRIEDRDLIGCTKRPADQRQHKRNDDFHARNLVYPIT